MNKLRKLTSVLALSALFSTDVSAAPTLELITSPIQQIAASAKQKAISQNATKTSPTIEEALSASLMETLSAITSKKIVYAEGTKVIEFYKNKIPTIKSAQTQPTARATGLPVSPMIIGGEPVPPDARGYQVSLQASGAHVCGGSLISSEWVLTAAHCVEPSIVRLGLDVVMGMQQLSSPAAITIPVSQIIKHPQFSENGSLGNDIALVRLAEPAPDDIPKLKLATPEIMEGFAQEGDIATVSGWGVMNQERELPDELMYVNVPIYNQQACADAYAETIGIPVLDSMICAGFPEGGKDSCNGDSGGPLTVEAEDGDYSIGIVSWGIIGCTGENAPGVYTRTVSFTDWIALNQETPAPQFERTEYMLEESPVIVESVETKKFIGITTSSPTQWIMDFSSDAPVSVKVYNNYFEYEEAVSCTISTDTENLCELPLASAGYYLIEITNENDSPSEVTLNNTFEVVTLADDTTYSGFYVLQGEVIQLPFEITEAGLSLEVFLFADNGDADIYVIAEESGALVCGGFQVGSDESCIVEDISPGLYSLYIGGFEATQNITLEFNLSESDISILPAVAICQHSVIAQNEDHFLAAINITNISDQFLTGWEVFWSYQIPTSIGEIQNAIITGLEPYQAEPAQPGIAIAPMSTFNIYMRVDSPLGLAENPEVFGNYCNTGNAF